MNFNRAEVVDTRLRAFLEGLPRGAGAEADLVEAGLDPERLLEVYTSQVRSRWVDLVSREMRARDESYYTIGSSGHEGNAVVAAHLRATDPCFLHYRSGAFMMQRGLLDPDRDPVRDTLLGVTASSEDPTSGGRHKVWGSRSLWVPPQTSTIASHLPKAVGAAMGIERAKHLQLDAGVAPDAIAVVTFGDASLNHSVSQGALNTAGWMSHQGFKLPLLFVCEDNGLGISVATPPGWVAARMRAQAGIHYVEANGLDLVEAWTQVRAAVDHCRRRRQPTFLHLRCVRLLGHAGSDIELKYRSLDEVEAVEALDPLRTSAAWLARTGRFDGPELLAHYEQVGEAVRAAATDVAQRPKLTSAAEVMVPLGPYDPAAIAQEATRPREAWAKSARPPREGRSSKAIGRQTHLAARLNQALEEALEKYPEGLIFGEDVARKGGVYHVTAGLWDKFGGARVFNTLLDETSILGLAVGAGQLGFLPIPEIQYLAYLHNAIDQLRSEACSLQFFSRDQFRNPMVVRVASYAYQRGFGGHFHNDNSIAALRDIPGLVIASPARGRDAVTMLRTCLATAKACGRVVAFLEPIALYMTKDLYEPNDGLWLDEYPGIEEAATVGEAGVYHGDAPDLTIVSYANGLYLSLRAARQLETEHGIRARVVDLRWLAPLDHDRVAHEAQATGKVLVVDECRRAGAVGEAVVAGLVERAPDVQIHLVAGDDSYLPLGPAMNLMLPDEASIVRGALTVCGKGAPATS